MIEVIGHENARDLLAQSRPQSLLLSGPEGVGRRHLAAWFAYGLNCEQGFPPCGQCASCRQTPHPDHFEIGPRTTNRSGETAQNPQIHIDQIVPRQGAEVQSLLEWIESAPQYRRKVAVIDGAHQMTEAAANALLKLLEEPPSYAHLVLIAPSGHSVLKTLASRCIEVRLAPLPPERLRTLSDDPDMLAFAQGAPGRLLWALEHPAEVHDVVKLVDGLLLHLDEGPRALELAKALLQQVLQEPSPLPFLQRAFARLEPTLRAEALALISEIEQARRAYVHTDLLAAYLVLKLRRIYGNVRPRTL